LARFVRKYPCWGFEGPDGKYAAPPSDYIPLRRRCALLVSLSDASQSFSVETSDSEFAIFVFPHAQKLGRGSIMATFEKASLVTASAAFVVLVATLALLVLS
jgi:hypothetical protein